MVASRALSALAVLGAAVGANAVTGVLSPGGTVYSYVNGGQDWKTATPLCGTSVVQSPINVPSQIVNYSVSSLLPLNVSYGTSSDWMLEVTANYLEVADIDTNTTGVNVSTSNAFSDGLTLQDGTFLPLNQFHFHTPSEHTINGEHYPLEMHMVHKLFQASASNTTIVPANTVGATLKRAAVIGIMFGYSPDGTDQPFMDNLQDAFFGLALKNFSKATTFSTSEDSANNQFSLMTEVFGASAIGKSDYFTYNGSLTTPGCNEGITWFLMNKPMYASPAQILGLTRALAIDQGGMSRGADNRLVQPLNGRNIFASFARPTAVNITATTSLAGLTIATFTAQKQTAFIGVIATQLNVQPTAVTITSITGTAARRRLLDASISVTTVVTVPSTAAKSLGAQLSAATASPTFVASMKTATGSTGVVNPATQPVAVASAAPAVKSAVAAVLAAAVLALAF